MTDGDNRHTICAFPPSRLSSSTIYFQTTSKKKNGAGWTKNHKKRTMLLNSFSGISSHRRVSYRIQKYIPNHNNNHSFHLSFDRAGSPLDSFLVKRNFDGAIWCIRFAQKTDIDVDVCIRNSRSALVSKSRCHFPRPQRSSALHEFFRKRVLGTITVKCDARRFGGILSVCACMCAIFRHSVSIYLSGVLRDIIFCCCLGARDVFVDRNDELRTCYAMMMQVVATCVYNVKYEIEVR